MIAAEKAGKTPQQFVGEIAAGRKPYLDGFHIEFDHWHSTDSPENTELAHAIYRALRDRTDGSLITTRTIEQFFDPVKSMFLPDRYIKGECPKWYSYDPVWRRPFCWHWYGVSRAGVPCLPRTWTRWCCAQWSCSAPTRPITWPFRLCLWLMPSPCTSPCPCS
jgi:hypothetical protein